MDNKTLTALFLLPCLGISEKKLKESGFINAYLSDVDHSFTEDDKQHYLYLLFQPENGTSLGNLINEYDSIISNEYDYPEGYVVLMCEFPCKWNTEYDLFLEGKYSKLSRQFMSTIPVSPTAREVEEYGYTKSEAHMIYSRDPIKWEQIEISLDITLPWNSELASIPNKEWETLDISKHLQQCLTC